MASTLWARGYAVVLVGGHVGEDMASGLLVQRRTILAGRTMLAGWARTWPALMRAPYRFDDRWYRATEAGDALVYRHECPRVGGDLCLIDLDALTVALTEPSSEPGNPMQEDDAVPFPDRSAPYNETGLVPEPRTTW